MNETSDLGVVHFPEIEVGASRQVGISVLTSDNVDSVHPGAVKQPLHGTYAAPLP